MPAGEHEQQIPSDRYEDASNGILHEFPRSSSRFIENPRIRVIPFFVLLFLTGIFFLTTLVLFSRGQPWFGLASACIFVMLLVMTISSTDRFIEKPVIETSTRSMKITYEGPGRDVSIDFIQKEMARLDEVMNESKPFARTVTGSGEGKLGRRKTCTECGNVGKRRESFCTKCGTLLIEKTVILTPSIKSCVHCGELLSATEEYCSDCDNPRDRCGVCENWIGGNDETGACPHCHQVFHIKHLKETIKVFGKCPACKEHLNETDIELTGIKKLTEKFFRQENATGWEIPKPVIRDNRSKKRRRKQCVDCGHTGRKKDIYCGKCGKRLVNASTTRSKPSSTCYYCGTVLAKTDRTCRICGKRRKLCEICKKWIRAGEQVGRCVHCGRDFHLVHLKEAVNKFGICPTCRKPLVEELINAS
ncbi:MAG: zinc ribbon domain-containing protein [Candidatus Odinarchaeota archaeon]